MKSRLIIKVILFISAITVSLIVYSKTEKHNQLYSNFGIINDSSSIYPSSKSAKIEDASESVTWEILNPKPSPYTGRDIVFLNDHIGFIINDNELLKTIDSGTTWNIEMNIPYARNIKFINNIGFIIGSNGLIYKSNQMGVEWNKLNTGFSADLNSVSLISEDTIIVTSSNKLFISNNGGLSWEETYNNNLGIQDAYFTSSKVGHIACQDGIFKTIDGGKNWNVTEENNSYYTFNTIHFINDSIGFASFDDYTLKTINAGESWTQVNSNSNPFYDFHFTNDTIGYTIGDYGRILKTIDVGENWSLIYSDATFDFNSVYFINESIGFAVGSKGAILKTINGGNTWKANAATYNNIEQLDMVTSDIGYALVNDEFYKTSDGGNTWVNIGKPIPNVGRTEPPIVAFSFANENIGYALTGKRSHDNVYKTVDGGENWKLADDNTNFPDLYCIDFVNENSGFVCGKDYQNFFYSTKNGGESWEKTADICFDHIQFIDSLTGFGLRNYSSYLFKTIDGGETWNKILQTDMEIHSFHFVDVENGYAVGSYGFIYKTEDGGSTWQQVEHPNHLSCEYVRFFNKNNGLVYDSEGCLYRTMNGGINWEYLKFIPFVSNINFTNKHAYISGLNGLIMRSNFEYDSISLIVKPLEDISNNSAILRGNVTSNVGDITTIYFEYGTDSTFNNSIKANIDTVYGNSSQNISAGLTNLEAGTIYQYRIKVKYQGKTETSTALEFTTLPNYKIEMKIPYCNRADRASVSATITSREDSITDIVFQYSSDTVYKSVTAIPASILGNSVITVNAELTDLMPETNYTVRLKAKQSDSLIYSPIYTFRTKPEFWFYPSSYYLDGENVFLTSTIQSNKDTIRRLGFEYGSSTDHLNYIESETVNISPGTQERIYAQLINFEPDSNYFCRLKVETDSRIAFGDYFLFSINNEILMIPKEVQALSDSSLYIKAYIHDKNRVIKDIQFHYGVSPNELNDSVSTMPSTFGSTYNVFAMLNSLTPDTKYYFIVRGTVNNSYLYSEIFSYTLGKPSIVEKLISEKDLVVYPNPTSNYLTISSTSQIKYIELFNSNGSLLSTEKDRNTINITNYPKGIYLLKVGIGNTFIIKKIIKN